MPITGADGGAVLETERLTLRPVAGGDLSDIVTLAGDIEVARWTASIRHPLGETEVAAWLARRTKSGEHAFAILRKGESGLIGVVGITVTAGADKGEIGYWIGRRYWGCGFATEAVRRVLAHGFAVLGLDEVEATVFPGNDRSARVLDKTGFTESKSVQRAAPARGGDCEVIVYTLAREVFGRLTRSRAAGCE